MKVKIVSALLKSFWYSRMIGKVFEVEDGSPNGTDYFVINDPQYQGNGLVKTDVEIIKEKKQMKATDKITLELTGKQLAKIYAVMGKTNGSFQNCIWDKAKEILDPHLEIYDKIVGGKGKLEVMDYCSYEDAWLKALFEEKSEAQLQLEKLQDQIAQLTKEADTLKGML